MAPASLISVFVAPVAGRLTDKIGGKYILMTGLILFGAGMGWLALIAHPDVLVAELPGAADRGRVRHGLRVRAAGHHGHAEHRAADGRRRVRRAEHGPAGRPGHRHRHGRRPAAEPAGVLHDQPGHDPLGGAAARRCAAGSSPRSSTRPATASRSGPARTAGFKAGRAAGPPGRRGREDRP